jgi:hypothetical protein
VAPGRRQGIAAEGGEVPDAAESAGEVGREQPSLALNHEGASRSHEGHGELFLRVFSLSISSLHLKLQLSGEIVGHRYLRTKLTQMKFELAMPPALVISWTGLLWLNHLSAFWST